MGIALLVLGAVAAVVGGLMLLVAAFRTSVLWGLACLFIPFAGLVYVVVHWEEARTGFLLNLAGLAVGALGLLFLPADAILGEGEVTLAGWQEPAPPAWEQPESPGSSRQAPSLAGPRPGIDGRGADLAAPRTGFGSAPQPRPPALEAATPPAPPPPAPPRREEVLHPSQAGAYLGKLVTIVQFDGKAFKARLRGVQGGWLLLERPVGGGAVTFPMPAERIRELRVSAR